MWELVSGIKINIIGNLFRFSRFGFIVLAARMYGIEAFGIYTLAWASVEILLRFGLLGLDYGILFEISHFHKMGEHRKLYQKIASSLKACIVISLVGTLALVLYARAFVDVPHTRNSLYLLAPAIPFYTVATLLIQATMGLKKMKYNAIIRSGIEPMAMVLLLFVFWKTPLRTYGIVLSQALALLLVFVLSLFVFRKYFSWREVFRTGLRRGRYLAIARYSLPMYVIELIDTMLYRTDLLLISHFLGTGTALQMKMIGVYGFAKQVARGITQTKNAFGPIFVPVSSESYLGKDTSQLWSQVRFAMEKILLLNIAIVLFMACFGSDLMSLAGKDASLLPQAAYLWLLAGQFAYSTFCLLMFFLVATQSSRRFLVFHSLLFGMSVLLGTFWVPRSGVVGASATISVIYLLMCLVVVGEVLHLHRTNFWTNRSWRTIGAGVIATLVILAVKYSLPASWNSVLVMLGAFLPGLCVYFIISTGR